MAEAGASRAAPLSKVSGLDAPSSSFASSLLSGPFGVGDLGARRLSPSENAADCVARLHLAIKDKDLQSMGELLLELADCFISVVASSPESMVSAARVVHEAAKLELATQGKQGKGALRKGKKGAANAAPAASVASVLLPSMGLAAGAERPEGEGALKPKEEESASVATPPQQEAAQSPAVESAGEVKKGAETSEASAQKESEGRDALPKERKIVHKKRIRRFVVPGEEGVSRPKLAGNKRLSSEMDEDELPGLEESLATFEIGSSGKGKEALPGVSKLGEKSEAGPKSAQGPSSSSTTRAPVAAGAKPKDEWQNLSQTLMPLANGKVASNDPLWGLASSLVAQEHTIPVTARAIFKAFSGLVMAICHTSEGKSNKNLSAEVYAALTETAVEVLHILKGQKLLAFALRFLGAIFPPKSSSSGGVGALGGVANKGVKAAPKAALPAPKPGGIAKPSGAPPTTAKGTPVAGDFVQSVSLTAPLKAMMSSAGAAVGSPSLGGLASGSPSSMALKARGIRAVAAVAFAATAPVVAEKAVKAIVNSLNSQQPELVSTGEALGAITTHLSSASLKTVCEDAINFTVYSMGRFLEASTIQVSGCIALASLTKTVSSTVLFNAWSAATAAMQHHPEDLRVQRAGCTALHNISSLVSLATPEWVSPKRPLWATRDNDREEAAQWLLAAMARFPDDIRVQWQGCHVLTTLLQSAGLRTVLFVAGKGGMGAIARAMRMCKKNEALIQQCCSALAALVQAAQEAGGDVIRREGAANAPMVPPPNALALGSAPPPVSKPVANARAAAHAAVNTQGSYGLDLLRAVAGDLVDLPAVLGADVAGLPTLGGRDATKTGGGDALLSSDSSREFLKSNRGRTGQRKHSGAAQNEAPTGEEWAEALRAVVGAMKQFPKLKLVQSNSCLLLGTAARMIPNDLAQILPAQVPFEEGLGLPAVDEKHLLIDQAIDAVVAAMDNHREDEIVQPWGAAFLAQAFLLYTTPSRAGQIIAQEHARRIQPLASDAQPSTSAESTSSGAAAFSPDDSAFSATAAAAKGKAKVDAHPPNFESQEHSVSYYGQEIDALPGSYIAAAIRANLKKACKALLKLAGLLESNTDAASNSLRRGWCEAMEIMVCTFGRLSLDVERGLVAAKWTQFSLENQQPQTGQPRIASDSPQPAADQTPPPANPPFSFPDPASMGLNTSGANPFAQTPFPPALGFPSSYSVSHIEVTTYIAALSNAAAMSAGGSQLLPAFLGNGLGFNFEPQALAAALGAAPPPVNPLPPPESSSPPTKTSPLAGGASRPATTLHAAASLPPAFSNLGGPVSAPWQQGASFTNFGLTHYSQSKEEEETWKALARFCRDYSVEEWRLAAHLTGQTAKPLGFKAHLLNVLSIATKSLTVQDDADVMHSLCLLITEIFLVWEHLHSGGNIVALHAAARASLEKHPKSAETALVANEASEVLRANGLATPKSPPSASQDAFELLTPDKEASTAGQSESIENIAVDGARLQTNSAASTSGGSESSSAASGKPKKAARQKDAAKPPSLGARGPNLSTRSPASNAPPTPGKPPPGVKKGPQSRLDLPLPVSLQERGSQPGVFTSDAGVGDMIEAVLYLTAMDGHFEALAAALEALHNCLLVAARPQEVDEFFGINSDGCKATDILAALKKAIAKPPIKITAETSPDVIREQDGRRRVAFEALLVLKAVCDKNVAAQLEVAVFEGIDLVFDAFDKYRDDEEMKDAAMKVLGLEEELWRKNACVQALWAALKTNRQKYLQERSKGLAKKKKKGAKADGKAGPKRTGGKKDDDSLEESVRVSGTAGISATRWQEIAEIVAGELHDDFPRRWGGLRTIDDLLSKEDFYSMLGLFLEDRKLAVEDLIGKDLEAEKQAELAVKYLQWIIQGHPDCGTVHLGLLRTAILYDEDEYLPGSGPNAAVKLLQFLNEKQANWSEQQSTPEQPSAAPEPQKAQTSAAQTPGPQWPLPNSPYAAGLGLPPSTSKTFPTPADILSSWASLFTGASSPFRHAPSWSPLSASNQKAVGPAATVFAQAQLCELLGHLSCDWEDELIEGGCISAVLDAMEAVWYWRDVKSMATLLPQDERLAQKMKELQNPPTLVLVRDHKGETALVVVPQAHTGLVWKGEWEGAEDSPVDARHFFVEAGPEEASSSKTAGANGVDKVRGGRAPVRDPSNPLSRAGQLMPREWRETLDSYLQRKALFALYSLCKEAPGKEAALQAQANHAATVAMCRYHPYEWNMGVRCGFNREVIKAAHLVLARLHIERIWDKNVTYWLAHECAKGNDHAALEAMVAEGLPGLWAEDGAGHVPLHYARELQRAACVAILEDLQRKRRAKKKGKKAKKKTAAEPAEQDNSAISQEPEAASAPAAEPPTIEAAPSTPEEPPQEIAEEVAPPSEAPSRSPSPSAGAALRSVVDASSIEAMRTAVEAYAALADVDPALVDTLKGIVEEAERTVVRSASAMVAGVKGRLDVLADSGSKRAIKNTHLLLEKIGQASTLSEFQAAVERYGMSSAADPVLCTVLADVLRESEKKMRESMAQAEKKVGESQGRELAKEKAVGTEANAKGKDAEGKKEGKEKKEAKPKGKDKKGGGSKKGKAAESSGGAKSKPSVAEEVPPPAAEVVLDSKPTQKEEEQRSQAAQRVIPLVEEAVEFAREEVFEEPAAVNEEDEDEWVNVMSRRKLRGSLKGTAPPSESERPLSGRQRRAKQRGERAAQESPERAIPQTPPQELPAVTPQKREPVWGGVETPPNVNEEDAGAQERTAWGPNAQPGGHLARRAWADQVEEEDRLAAVAESLPLDKRRVAEAESKRSKGKARGNKQRGKAGRGSGLSNGSAAILPSPLPPLLPTPSESLHVTPEPDGRSKRRPNTAVSDWPAVTTPTPKAGQKPLLTGTGVFHAAEDDPNLNRGLPSEPAPAPPPLRPTGAAWGRPPSTEPLADAPLFNTPVIAPITPLQQQQQWAPVTYPDLPASLDDFHSTPEGAQAAPLWMESAERPPSNFAAGKYSNSFFQSAAQDTVVNSFPRLPSPQASVASSADWNSEARPSSAALRTSRPSSSAGIFPEAEEPGSPPLSPSGHVLHSILSDLLPDAREDESAADSQPFDLNGESFTDVHLPAGLLASDDPVSSAHQNLAFGSLPADLGDLGAESVHPLPPAKPEAAHPLGGFWPEFEDHSPRIPASPGLPNHLQNTAYMGSPYGYQSHLGYSSPVPSMYSGHPIYESYSHPRESEPSHSLFSAVQHTPPGYPPDRPGSGNAQGQEQRMLFMEDPCTMCMERQKNCALLPCGHRCCGVCSQQMHMRRIPCPMCNRSIEGVLQLFA